MSTDLKADLDKYLKEKLDPINKKMIEQEKEKHKQFLERHFAKYDELAEKHDSYISQLINLEGAIFGAVVIFTNSEQITTWLILAVCLILISLMFGIWRQNIAIESKYQSHEWSYYQELKNHWWSRELWNDESLKTEKEIIESNLKARETIYEKNLSYKILKITHLNADRVENIFKISLVLALSLLILHLFFKSPIFLTK